MQKIERILLLFIAVIWFGLVAVNVNFTLGTIYLVVFTVWTSWYIKEDKKRNLPFDRTGKWGLPIAQAILIYGAFVIISSLLLPYFQKIKIGALLQLIATSSPALAESQILNSISFIFLIPLVETMFFVAILDLVATEFRIDISRKSLFRPSGAWLLILLFSFLFLLYHVNAKGITNNAALLIVFLMMVFTLFFAVFFQEAKQVVGFHIISNGVALNLFAFSGGIVPLLGLIILLNKNKFKRLKWKLK